MSLTGYVQPLNAALNVVQARRSDLRGVCAHRRGGQVVAAAAGSSGELGETGSRRTNCGPQGLSKTTPLLLVPSRPCRSWVTEQPNHRSRDRAGQPRPRQGRRLTLHTAGIPSSTPRHTGPPRTRWLRSWAPPRMLMAEARTGCTPGHAAAPTLPRLHRPTQQSTAEAALCPPRPAPFLIGCFPAVSPAPCTTKRWKRPLTPRTAQPTGPSLAAHTARTEGAAEGAIRGCRGPQGQRGVRKRFFHPPAHLTAFIRRSCFVQTRLLLSSAPLLSLTVTEPHS